MRSHLPDAVLWLLSAAVVSLNVYRACAQSVAIDEAYTYSNFVARSPARVDRLQDANNHILNTILARTTIATWGPKEWALRAPSLLGGAIYLLTSLLLVQFYFGKTVEQRRHVRRPCNEPDCP